jgi:hypothetical protein
VKERNNQATLEIKSMKHNSNSCNYCHKENVEGTVKQEYQREADIM